MKIKKIVPIFVFALVFLLPIAYADPWVTFLESSLTSINSFFVNEGYKPYAKAIDFFFFAFLFIAIYMMGVRYAFKEVKRPEKVVAILLGLMSAFLLVLADFSVTILLPYVQWILYILLFTLYYWLLKAMKSKFWRFILALLLTLLTIALVQGLFNYLVVPEGEVARAGEGLSEFFSSFADSFKGIQLEGVTAPGVPDYLRDLFELPPVTTPSEPEAVSAGTTPAAAAPEDEGLPWWVWALILIAAASAGPWAWKKWRQKPKEEAKPSAPAQPKTLQEIIAKIDKIIDDKKKSIQSVVKAQEEKNRIIKDTTQRVAVLAELERQDPANLWEGIKSIQEVHPLKDLLEKEIKLVEELIKLKDVEKDVFNDSMTWVQSASNITQDLEELRNLIARKTVLKEIKNMGIIWFIKLCYDMEKRGEVLAKELEHLFEEDKVRELVEGKFKTVRENQKKLDHYNQYETSIIKLLSQKIELQISKLGGLKRKIMEAQVAPVQGPAQAPAAPAQAAGPVPQQAPPQPAQETIPAPAPPPQPAPEPPAAEPAQNRTGFQPAPARQVAQPVPQLQTDVLVLTPTNSKRKEPIVIIGRNHADESSYVRIGKLKGKEIKDNKIHYMVQLNSINSDGVHATIGYNPVKNKFLILKKQESPLEIKDASGKNISFASFENRDTKINIGEYEFIVTLASSKRVSPEDDMPKNKPIVLIKEK